MNHYELLALLAVFDDLDFEDLEPHEFDTEIAKLTPEVIANTSKALRELVRRRLHDGDIHGCEVPS